MSCSVAQLWRNIAIMPSASSVKNLKQRNSLVKNLQKKFSNKEPPLEEEPQWRIFTEGASEHLQFKII